MPLVDPDDNDNGSAESEESHESKRSNGDGGGGGGGGRLVVEPPEEAVKDDEMTAARRTRPLVDRGVRSNPPRAVFPEELQEIAESRPARARQLVKAMEENGEITELKPRASSDGNPLMEERERANDTRLRERVNQLEKEVQALDDAVSTLVELHDEVPFSAECEECGGRMEFKQPFTGDNRLECENCGDTKPKGAGG